MRLSVAKMVQCSSILIVLTYMLSALPCIISWIPDAVGDIKETLSNDHGRYLLETE